MWLSQVISELADGLQYLLILFLISKLTDNPLVISFVLLARVLPGTLLSAFIGPFIDKYSKKRIMVISDLYRAGIILIVILFSQSIAGLLILVFLGGRWIFFEPARTSSLPKILDKKRMPEAIGLSQSTMQAMMLVGPAICGILLSVLHYHVIFLITAGCYVLSACFITQLKLIGNSPRENDVENRFSLN
ncbi:hypothetical protein CUU66_09795 [Peribacillus deserti]|uniref:Major facilitator superfamily (MFS) profile domain-containing protein n=1 Tax=Peribacillus deserti TaxID=673318 RepID=A0A2N5M6S4_9BACI|nr:hypothetical protein CUU66_09795 [Peribacillus deserti]